MSQKNRFLKEVIALAIFLFRIQDLKTDLHSETSSFRFVSQFLSNKNLSTLVSVINVSILQRDAGGF